MKNKLYFLGLVFGAALFLGGCGAVKTAIEQGGEWFLNAQNEDFIYYERDPETGWTDEGHSMREMGALWAITQIWHYLDDDRFEDLAYRGFDHFKKSFVVDEANDFIYVNVTPDKIKLGYSAFAILTLLELDDENKDEYLRQLANGIIYQQQANGELKTFFYSDRDTGKDYYPGEALLAMMSIYEETGEQRYLDVVTKAFPFYVSYWNSNENTAFVPWQTQAFYKYYEVTKDPAVADFIFSMNDYMVSTHEDFASSIVTAVYVEGMNKAYMLADELNDSDRQFAYSEFIKNGLAAVMKMQCLDCEGSDYGGFWGNADDQSMRVDRNQHAVMALIGASELGLLR